METKASLRFGSLVGRKIVEFTIGSTREIVPVHKDILCAKILHFKTVFNSGMQETLQQSAILPNLEVGAFEVSLEWLYTDRLDIVKSDNITDYIGLYGFAE